MKEYLKSFLRDFEYPDECRALLLSCYDSIVADGERRDALEAVLAAYSDNKNVSYFVIEEYVLKISKDFEFHEYTVWLLVYILMTKRLLELYRESGLSLKLWRESIKDLKIKTEECREVKGIYGTFVGSWFPNFFRLRRFALGRLQFELTTYKGEQFVCSDGTAVSEGDAVLAVHIPRSETALSKENCDAAYTAAAEFFAKDFQGEKIVFTCSSWMLYPKNSEILHERSNTRRFGEEYEIVSVSYDEAGEHPEAWRIFGVECNGNVKDLPESSHLMRAYKEYMFGGGVTGRAYGIKLLQKNAK